MMKRWWVYGMSFLITALGIGGTLFFFMKGPQEESVVSAPIEDRGGIEASSAPATLESQSSIVGPAVSNVHVDERFALAKQFKAEGEYNKAREILGELIQNSGQVSNIEEIEKEYWDTNVKLIFSNQQVEGWTQEVVVEKGDSLFLIANRFHTTADLLRESNHLDQKGMIRPAQALRVFAGEISLLVDKSLNTLALKVNGEVIKVYRVGTGTEGSTPTGDFKIVNKLENPPWFHAGKVIPFGSSENILGTRWMGFDKQGYGIHGTWEPSTVGTQSSAGCVRLVNEEVEELYKIVPAGTLVTVVE